MAVGDARRVLEMPIQRAGWSASITWVDAACPVGAAVKKRTKRRFWQGDRSVNSQSRHPQERLLSPEDAASLRPVSPLVLICSPRVGDGAPRRHSGRCPLAGTCLASSHRSSVSLFPAPSFLTWHLNFPPFPLLLLRFFLNPVLHRLRRKRTVGGARRPA